MADRNLTPKIRCRWCEGEHTARFMCDPLQRVVDELNRRGMEGNMPTIEFDQPKPLDQLGFGGLVSGPGDQVVRQWVIKAGMGEVAGVMRPLLLFTGRGYDGSPLPTWVYIADDQDMAGLVQLVSDTADMAMRAARGQRGPVGRD